MKIKKEFSDEVQEALANHGEWAKPTFGNGLAGLIYGLVVGMGVCLYYIAGVWASMAAIPSLVFFWLLCKYDNTVVSFWNEREKERVVTQWLTKNIDRVLEDGTQVIVTKGNLDGTNEDE